MDYIDRIKAEREDHDESQREIAKALNMTQSQYQKYEAKINAMPIRYLIEICHHYKIEDRKERDNFIDTVIESCGYKVLHTRNIIEEEIIKFINEN